MTGELLFRLNKLLEEFNFNFSFEMLCDLDIPRGKCLNYLQTVDPFQMPYSVV